MFKQILKLFFLASVSSLYAAIAHAEISADQVRQRTEVVQIYLDELKDLTDIGTKTQTDMQSARTSEDKMRENIRSSTRIIHEMESINIRLEALKLEPPFDTISSSLHDLNESRILLNQELVQGAKFALTADEGDLKKMNALAARAPELQADMENINRTIFKFGVGVATALIDTSLKNSEGKYYRLILTGAQRAKMIAEIEHLFGKELDKDDKSFYAGGADLIRMQLRNSVYQSADAH